jgi:RimJ/RimL family protein N-acetyltransferase
VEAGARRVTFDESYLDCSYQWLSDPVIAELIMSAPVSREAQRAWWNRLPDRDDYAIWGIECDGLPVGVMGLKDIGVDDGAEYFIYIGERDFWGRGLAAWGVEEVAEEIRTRGYARVYGRIGKHNERSLAAHTRLGFEIVRDDGDTWWLARHA